MEASDIRARARQVLAGRWPMAILVGFVASLLGGAGNSESGLTIRVEEKVEQVYSISPELATILMGMIGAIGVFAFAYAIAMLVVGGAVQQGYCRYNLNLVDGREAQFADLFSQFGRFGDAFVLNLLTGVYIFLWGLLFIIPGIVASYRYAKAPYIMLEDPNCTPSEAIARSKEMMDGHKGELFWLHLTFIGWDLLAGLGGVLGKAVLRPYTQTAEAVFYRDLQHRQRQQYQNIGTEA